MPADRKYAKRTARFFGKCGFPAGIQLRRGRFCRRRLFVYARAERKTRAELVLYLGGGNGENKYFDVGTE